VGGDFRRNSIEINGIQLLLLTRGEWKNFADDELLAKIESIINVQRTFWSDYSDDIYTVTLLPLESESGIQMGGTGLAKGFASYCSNSKRSSIDNLTGLYYHEIMHHWIGGKIRNATDYKELWFSEGFTEYFAHLLMQEEGEITAEQLINEIELARQTLRGRSKVNVNNDAIRLNSETEKLPYLRGFVYADYLDKRLQKKRGICLRDVMLRILEDSEQQVFSNDYFQDLLDSYLGSNDVKKFEKFILEGSKIP
jgi:predicted metalloprotease with PDZ domain